MNESRAKKKDRTQTAILHRDCVFRTPGGVEIDPIKIGMILMSKYGDLPAIVYCDADSLEVFVRLHVERSGRPDSETTVAALLEYYGHSQDV